jgi:hypothetical protein
LFNLPEKGMGGTAIENGNIKPPQVLRTLLEAFPFWG